MPAVLLLLFGYVFGATLGAGLGHPGAGRAAYAGYVAPGEIVAIFGQGLGPAAGVSATVDAAANTDIDISS